MYYINKKIIDNFNNFLLKILKFNIKIKAIISRKIDNSIKSQTNNMKDKPFPFY